jgi:hypothetical protein
MDHLPESVVKALEGAIVRLRDVTRRGLELTYQDPHSQHLIETHSQTSFIALTVSPSFPLAIDQVIDE